MIRDVVTAAAVEANTDEAAALVRYVEAAHGNGWTGRTVQSTDDIQAAANLRTLIEATRTLRLPAGLADAATVVEQASVLVAKATNVKTHKVVPVNLTQACVAARWKSVAAITGSSAMPFYACSWYWRRQECVYQQARNSDARR